MSLSQVSPQEANELERRKKFFLSKDNKYIREFYNNSPGLDYVPSAEVKAHAEFDGKNKDAENTKRHIDTIYRIRVGGFKGHDEKMYFTETYVGHDHRGQKISKFVVNGKQAKPLGRYEYDEISGTSRCIGIEEWETIYDYKFDPKQIADMLDDGIIDAKTKFAVGSEGGRLYGGFEYEDFISLPFDDLIFLGKTGSRPTQEEKTKEIKSKANRDPTGLKE
jgi:hypothetical protein